MNNYAISPRCPFLHRALVYWIIFLLLTGCIPNPINTSPLLLNTPNPTQPAKSSNPQVTLEWTYQDSQRFAVELSIRHYELPQGFQTICPLTKVEIRKNDNESLLLYKNPEQINLAEFYAITKQSRWICKQVSHIDGAADYLFSLNYYYDDANFNRNEYRILSIELAEVIATNTNSVLTLPNQGTFTLPLNSKVTNGNLTWDSSEVVAKNNVSVEIKKVAVTPSFALLDTCVEYQDHHFWRPVTTILYDGKEVDATDFIPSFPPYPYTRDNLLESTRRCYSHIIPFDFPIASLSTFKIGIKRMEIVNTDSGVVTWQECDTVKKKVEEEYPGLKIRCYEFETRGQQQHWFEILTPQPGTSTQDSYELVESTFIRVIPGPWYIEIP